MTSIKAFLDEDTPEVELHPGQTQLSDRRARMSFAQLLEEFDKGYGALAEFVSGLSPQQLARKAHVEALKESRSASIQPSQSFSRVSRRATSPSTSIICGKYSRLSGSRQRPKRRLCEAAGMTGFSLPVPG